MQYNDTTMNGEGRRHHAAKERMACVLWQEDFPLYLCRQIGSFFKTTEPKVYGTEHKTMIL